MIGEGLVLFENCTSLAGDILVGMLDIFVSTLVKCDVVIGQSNIFVCRADDTLACCKLFNSVS